MAVTGEAELAPLVRHDTHGSAGPAGALALALLEPIGPDQPAPLLPALASRDSLLLAVVKTARPKQWTKNVLVFAAPAAAGVLTSATALADTFVAFGAFSLVASGTYFFNDVLDRDADRRHPRKCRRPVASGALPVPMAVAAGVVAILSGLLVGAAAGWQLDLVLALYGLLTITYSIWLKHVPVVDIAVVASGFLIRAVAGAVATGVPISQWFLIVASFGSLFMVAGKRHAEFVEPGTAGPSARRVLDEYSLAYLRYVWMLASGAAITAYCLWAFEQGEGLAGFPWYKASIVPFVLALLRYALLVDQGRGASPEELVLRDRGLRLAGFAWVLLFLCAVYVPA